jgi:hypothetical protein
MTFMSSTGASANDATGRSSQKIKRMATVGGAGESNAYARASYED